MKINFTNISNLIKRIQSPSNTYENKISDSNNANISQSKTSERNLTQNLNISGNFQAIQLSSGQKAMLMRELLNLPKDMKDFLTLFLDKDASQEKLLDLLKTKNTKIDLAEIKQLLDTNSKEVINKLIKLVQQDPRNPQGAEQIKEILNTLSQILPQNKLQQQDTLKAVMLLYLPWLPLVQPQDIKLGIEEKKQEAGEEEDEHLIVLISTINLGRFKITLITGTSGQLNINIENNNQKNSDDEDYKKQILEKINNEILKLKITPKTEFQQSIAPKETNEDKRSVSFQPVSKVSPQLMLSAYTVIKIIFELDENASLLSTRKEMIDK